MDVKLFQMWLGGERTDATSEEFVDLSNPYTGEVWAFLPRSTAADVVRTARAAHAAFNGLWSRLNATALGELLLKQAALLPEYEDVLTETEVRDNGKLVAEMRAQMRYVPKGYSYFGPRADKSEGAVLPIDEPGLFNYTRYEPVGVVEAITPWASPLMLQAYKIAPALAAGNCVVIKPSEFTSASTLEFAKAVEEAGFPAYVFYVVPGFGNQVGAALMAHDPIDKVSFTGSDQNGQRVYEDPAKTLKRVSLELSGKSPNIVFAGAVLDGAVKGTLSGIFVVSDQSCLAGSRLLVEDLVSFVKSVRLGHQADPQTQVGPIGTLPQHRKILDYLAIAHAKGAPCVPGRQGADGSAVHWRPVRGAHNIHRREQPDVHRAREVGRLRTVHHPLHERRRSQRHAQRPDRQRADAEHRPCDSHSRPAASALSESTPSAPAASCRASVAPSAAASGSRMAWLACASARSSRRCS